MVDKNLVKDVISKGNMLVLVPCVARILYSFFFLNLMLSCPWLYLLETLIIKVFIYLSFFGLKAWDLQLRNMFLLSIFKSMFHSF